MGDLMGGTPLFISKTETHRPQDNTPPPTPIPPLLTFSSGSAAVALYPEILLFSCEASTARVLIEDNLYP